MLVKRKTPTWNKSRKSSLHVCVCVCMNITKILVSNPIQSHPLMASNDPNWPFHRGLPPKWTKREKRGSSLAQHMLATCMTDWLFSLHTRRRAYHLRSSQPISNTKKIQLLLRLPSMLVSLNEAYSVCHGGVSVSVCVCAYLHILEYNGSVSIFVSVQY